MSNNLSQRLFEEARRVMPGGVNSPVRSFRGVGGRPSPLRGAAALASGTPTGPSTSTTWARGGR